MKYQFKSINFRHDSLSLVEQCNSIVDSYLAQNLRLTLRQLYYQLVTKNIIPNIERSYKNLSNLVSDARLAGLIDWDAIEDRLRVPVIPSQWNNIASLVESALYSYRLPRWEGQGNYIELWVEKDALAGVLRPIANQFHIPLMVNRGYSSMSAMYEASTRILREGDYKDKTILYLGDFDPSGEDMVRDIGDRMSMFGVSIIVKKIALTLDQVHAYNPPPNPAKHTDPRSKDFIAKHGSSSWEVDAIDPVELRRIIVEEIGIRVDVNMMNEVIKREETDKVRLREAAKKIMEV